MVPENLPFPFLHTAGNYETQKEVQRFMSMATDKQEVVGARRVQLWDHEYNIKTKKWSDFIITKPIFINLIDPPIVTDGMLDQIFHQKINTRTPKIITVEQFKSLAHIAGVNFIHA